MEAGKRVFTQCIIRSRKDVSGYSEKTLEPDPVIRRESFGNCLSVRELEKDFARLYGITAGDDVHFEPVHDRIAGLEAEVGEIKAMICELKRMLEG